MTDSNLPYNAVQISIVFVYIQFDTTADSVY